ncbi:MAG: redoxin domain-containing protein [Acidobacteria bacterium]|nr:redoxin domain-containing protein [Acidobacteriota bacterium]
MSPRVRLSEFLTCLPIAVSLCFAPALWAQVEPPTPADLVGVWANADPNGDVTEIAIRQTDTGLSVRVWAACAPADCDWGDEVARWWSGSLVATYGQGFVTDHLQLIPRPDGGLVLLRHGEFHDGSGRGDIKSAEFFRRKAVAPDSAASRDAQLILNRVAEMYRSLPPSRFAFARTVLRSKDTAVTRSVTEIDLRYSPPNTWRREWKAQGERVVEIADGQTLWTVYPDSNEYESQPQGTSRLMPLDLDYVNLNVSRSSSMLDRRERLDNGVECAVVRLDLGRGFTRDLWIDTSTHVVWKDLTVGAYTIEVVFSEVQVGTSVSGVFRYDPSESRGLDRARAEREAPESLVGTTAPDIELPDLDGRRVRLRDLRGKVVLLDFWATWCGPCREALPTLEVVHRGLKEKGLVVLGVNPEAPSLARQFLFRENLTFTSLVDADEEAVRAFRVSGWPTQVLIDRDGKITLYSSGTNERRLVAALRAAGAW